MTFSGHPNATMNPIRHSLGHLLSCKDVSRLLSQAEERPMSAWDRLRVNWHLAVCRMCRAFDRQLATMREAMRRYRS
jgi:hypothetical protein